MDAQVKEAMESVEHHAAHAAIALDLALRLRDFEDITGVALSDDLTALRRIVNRVRTELNEDEE